MGTPDFATALLKELCDRGHEIAAVYTQPPRPANRGRLTPSPVHRRAEELGLACELFFVDAPLRERMDAARRKFFG